ncbi:HAD hydrolase-like protein [Paenarthrobacter sp. NPDC089989]|uniref:HAD hydrolase-like protein n=1 Tax=unclassified Paenarthrobacter TaxID=2634190 RepID=UPI0037FF050A
MFAAALDSKSFGGTPWMVGDHVEADISGARAAGCFTAWVSHGQSWTKKWQPTLKSPHASDLLVLINDRLFANYST